jgi:transglutaminase-like putative cysteine protease
MSRRTEFSGSLMALLLVGFGTPVLAAPLTVLNEDEVYDVNADGSYVVDGRVSRRVDETQAVAQAGQYALPYSESLQKLEIIEAYTTTKDGTRIDVPADKIVSQQLPASAGAPTFSDYKLQTVIFPQVEVGAVLTLHYKITQLKPKLPGVFSVHSLFNRFVDYKGATMTVRAPEKMALYFSAQGVPGGEVKATRPGTRELHWTYGGATATLAEPGSVSIEDLSPGITVSTLKDYPALAAAYMIGAEPAAKVTPAVQKLADEITAGVTDKRAQAEAIYRWVSVNIRYVALLMGAGGYVPHTADEIISVKYGDCKDKTTLMMALLGAKGIRSAPVLVNAVNRYTLPATPVLSAFNHAINWLPDFNLFVDSTSGFAPFGVLRDALMGKQALIAGGINQNPSLATLPVSNPATDQVLMRTSATLAADGTVSGTNHVEATGMYEPVLRTTLASIPPAQIASVGSRLLASAGQVGEATLTLSDMRDLKKPVSMDVQFRVPARVNLPGPGALTGVYGIRPPVDIGSLVASIMQMERKLDFPCLSGSFDEKVELTLPPDFRISNLPHPSDVQSPLASFVSSFTEQDHKLVITRRLEVKYPHVVCNNADSIELRKFATSVGKDLRAQILYQ